MIYRFCVDYIGLYYRNEIEIWVKLTFNKSQVSSLCLQTQLFHPRHEDQYIGTFMSRSAAKYHAWLPPKPDMRLTGHPDTSSYSNRMRYVESRL